MRVRVLSATSAIELEIAVNKFLNTVEAKKEVLGAIQYSVVSNPGLTFSCLIPIISRVEIDAMVDGLEQEMNDAYKEIDELNKEGDTEDPDTTEGKSSFPRDTYDNMVRNNY